MSDPQERRVEAVEFDPNTSESARVPSSQGPVPVSDSPTLPLPGEGLLPSQQETQFLSRKGPAPRNLEIPPYAFVNDTTVKIG